ncbi:MAG: cyclopropane-fatty-acyl-phospholipid synthase [Albidovulum sp.]|nr:cyclopropane-fatty-acyl-phospholipid synthase [Albidovulum sp.]
MWQRLLSAMFRKFFVVGRIDVRMPNGEIHTFGDRQADPVSISIKDTATARKLCLHPELSVGEAYMDGTLTIENDDLHGFLTVVLKNIADSEDLPITRVLRGWRNLRRNFLQFNTSRIARSNVEHHYDLSDRLYELFLDEDRQYSCAYFEDEGDSLEYAQIQKKRHIARKLLLSPGQKVLDIGSGWGGMGITLAREYGVDVTGVTLSKQQYKKARERAAAAGESHRAKFLLKDYRAVEGTFDRIVSVGMFEHVGAPHYLEFFKKIKDILADDGIALLHTIGRSGPPGSTNPWITKYIFPGGYVPAMSETMAAVEMAGLTVTDVEVLRLHYAETLKNWHSRFISNIEEIRREYDERFCRMWRFYLLSCEMTFRYNDQVVFQFQIAKRKDSVPLTRDYLYAN